MGWSFSCNPNHVLKWGLPMDEALKAAARRLFGPEYLAQFPNFASSSAEACRVAAARNHGLGVTPPSVSMFWPVWPEALK